MDRDCVSGRLRTLKTADLNQRQKVCEQVIRTHTYYCLLLGLILSRDLPPANPTPSTCIVDIYHPKLLPYNLVQSAVLPPSVSPFVSNVDV